MIQILFNPNSLKGEKKKEWDAWLEKSQKATAEVIQEFEDWMQKYEKWCNDNDPDAKPPAFEPNYKNPKTKKKMEKIWKDMRDWLLKNVFYNKCAYCEVLIARAVSDTEHYRPKNRVKDAKVIDWRGNEVDHPGYFWLAYNWKNLLPSCQDCNRKHKLDRFPVAKSNISIMKLTKEQVTKCTNPVRHSTIEDLYYLEPEDLNVYEEPELLHPFFDDPLEHIRFNMKGVVRPVAGSVKGTSSIDNFSLNLELICEIRSIIMRTGSNQYMKRIFDSPLNIEEKERVALEFIKEYIKSPMPFAGAVFSYLNDHLGEQNPLNPYVLLKKNINK